MFSPLESALSYMSGVVLCPGQGRDGGLGAGGAVALGALVYCRDWGALAITLRKGGAQFSRLLDDCVLALTAPYTADSNCKGLVLV